MKIAVDRLGILRKTLWQGDGLRADWDVNKRELVVQGDANNQTLFEVVLSVLSQRKLSVRVQENGSTKLKWHGRVQSAEFGTFEGNRSLCFLRISLDS